MSKPTVLIVDDEPHVRVALRRFLGGRADLTLVGEAADGLEAVEMVERLRPDVLFLDVQMPLLDGIAVARELAPPRPAIVFVTAFEHYAIQAFDLHAVDYILKPFDEARLARAVERALERYATGASPGLDQALAALTPRYLSRFLVRTGPRLQVVRVSEVDWFESADNYVKAHVGKEVRTIRGTLRELEDALDPSEFVRVHRTALVRIDAILEILPRPSGDADIRLAGGATVPLSRQLRPGVIRRIGREG